MRIALTNLKEYNNGNLIFEWVELPVESFDEVFDRIGRDEYFITDYECEISNIQIGEYDNIYKLNKLAERIGELEKYEKPILDAIIEASGADLEEALDILEDSDYIFYEVDTLEELAEMFVEDGIFGNIPDYLLRYIDYEKIGRDLEHDGYVETSAGIILVN